jgi:DNA-binding protein HU-beta
MNKSELISRVSRESGLNRGESIRAVRALVAAIRDTIKEGGKISLTGLGCFKVKARKGRPGRNPQNGEAIVIPAGRKISFKPSLAFKKLAKG